MCFKANLKFIAADPDGVGLLVSAAIIPSIDHWIIFLLLYASPTDDEKLTCNCPWTMHFNEVVAVYSI